MISEKLRPFGTSVFTEMTALAETHGAINLAQGFPDSDGPREVIEAAVVALREGHNQYARSMGVRTLASAVADQRRRLYDLSYDPETEVAVFCGATEGIASSMLGILNPGDEVILFEPFFDTYPACVALAGAEPRYYCLRFPEFELDVSRLAALFNDRTRLLVLNTPHNPTGKVFSRAELEAIADLCRHYDVPVLADEVYEHLTFEGQRHVPIAGLPGMRERTLSLSSIGKTFSVTGWKIGWATGPAPLIAASQAAHQFVTFCAAAPLQVAAARALADTGAEYYRELRSEYAARRDLLIDALTSVGFEVATPSGTYFCLANFRLLSAEDDVAFSRRLTAEYGVAAIPPSVFYSEERDQGRDLVRFAFCKRLSTLNEAATRLGRLKRER